jgi:hypothetical protein
MTKNEPKFAISANAHEPPPDQFHTAEEWEANIALLGRDSSPNSDLVTSTLNHEKIWAKYNATGGAIQRVTPASEDA